MRSVRRSLRPSFPCLASLVFECHRPWRGSVVRVLAILGSLLSLAVAAAAQGPTITTFSPGSGGPGSAISLQGNGFSPSVEDSVAFVYDDLTGTGATFEIRNASPTQLDGVLGPSPALFGGELTLWTGRRYVLPTALHQGVAATYLIQQATWFVPSSSATASSPFNVTGDSPTLAAARIGGKIILPVGDPDGPGQGIGLDIMVGGGGPPGGGKPPARRITITIEWIEAQASFSTVDLANDLATVLEATYGPLGLHTVAVGDDLQISWDGTPVLDFGFAVAQWIDNP